MVRGSASGEGEVWGGVGKGGYQPKLRYLIIE